MVILKPSRSAGLTTSRQSESRVRRRSSTA